MAKLPIDLAGFKKTSSSKDSTVLEHKNGHKIELNHKALSPKMKEQLEKLVTSSKVAPKKELGEKKKDKEAAPMAFADGGKVPGGNGSPAIDPKKAKEIESSANQSGFQPHQWMENLKNAFSPAPEASPEPKKMADGGEVPPLKIEEIKPTDKDAPLQVEAIDAALSRAPASSPLDQVASPIAEAPLPGASGGDAASLPAGTSMPAAASTPLPAAPAPAAPPPVSDPYGYQTTANVYTGGLNLALGGLQGQAAAEGQITKDQTKALQDGQAAQQKLMADYQSHTQALQGEIKNVTDDIKNGHIDPNHFMSSLDTGGRIATGIGLLLGGLGAGGTGGKNLALDNLNHQIDRDIDAQKAEMGKKQNLVSALFQQYGNLTSATQMASAMSRNILADQIQAAAAKSGDKLAQARADQAEGQLRMQAANTVGGLAMKQTLLGGMQSGHVAPEQVVRAIVPEAQQPAAYKELQEAQNTAHAKDNILSTFDQLNKINTTGNFVTSPIQTQKQVAALRDPLVAGLSKATAGRFTETDAKFIDSLFPAKGDSEETIASKRAQINKIISEKMNFPLIKTYGIDVNSFGRYNGPGQERITAGPPKLGQ